LKPWAISPMTLAGGKTSRHHKIIYSSMSTHRLYIFANYEYASYYYVLRLRLYGRYFANNSSPICIL